jgi:hypothetical protein
MFRSYNYGMRLVVASSRGSIDIDLDDLSLGALSCSRCFLLRFEWGVFAYFKMMTIMSTYISLVRQQLVNQESEKVDEAR